MTTAKETDWSLGFSQGLQALAQSTATGRDVLGMLPAS